MKNDVELGVIEDWRFVSVPAQGSNRHFLMNRTGIEVLRAVKRERPPTLKDLFPALGAKRK